MRLALFVAVLLVVTEGAALAQDLQRGRRVFTRCTACHSIDSASTDPKPGPTLAGVVGRKAASVAGFEYSPEMVEAAKKGLVWSEENLDKYLQDSQAFVPGSSMGEMKVTAAPDRKALIDLIKAAK